MGVFVINNLLIKELLTLSNDKLNFGKQTYNEFKKHYLLLKCAEFILKLALTCRIYFCKIRNKELDNEV